MTNSEIRNRVISRLKMNLYYTFIDYKISHELSILLSEVSYDAFFRDELEINDSTKELLSNLIEYHVNDKKLRKTILDKFIKLYSSDLYDRVAFYFNGIVNGTKIQTKSTSIYKNDYVPIGCNSSTFENDPIKGSEVNTSLLNIMPI